VEEVRKARNKLAESYPNGDKMDTPEEESASDKKI
jgi:hypothetical protein